MAKDRDYNPESPSARACQSVRDSVRPPEKLATGHAKLASAIRGLIEMCANHTDAENEINVILGDLTEAEHEFRKLWPK